MYFYSFCLFVFYFFVSTSLYCRRRGHPCRSSSTSSAPPSPSPHNLEPVFTQLDLQSNIFNEKVAKKLHFTGTIIRMNKRVASKSYR